MEGSLEEEEEASKYKIGLMIRSIAADRRVDVVRVACNQTTCPDLP
jgi:hypothetical protein